MAIFSDTDILAAMKKRQICLKPLLKEPGPSSVDLHIRQVYQAPRFKSSEECYSMVEMPFKEFEKKFLEPLPMVERGSDSYWIIEPKKYYICVSAEKLDLVPYLAVDVDTRSSWARYGMRVQHCDDDLQMNREKKYSGRVPFTITAADVPMRLRKGDRPCQAIFYDESSFGTLFNKQLLEVLKSGEVKCYKKKQLIDGELVTDAWDIENHALCLTLNRELKKFTDRLIDPKTDVTNCYRDFDLGSGQFVKSMEFFLGSSNETMAIGSRYVGMLKELYVTPMSVRTHSNAGYIDPGYEGTITLEQYVPPHGIPVLFPGMKMGEVEICRLKSPCTNPYKSTYSGQYGTTPSMGHLDYINRA